MKSLDRDLFELIFERLDQSTAGALWRALLGPEARWPTGQEEGVREAVLESLTLRPGVVLGDVHVRLLCYDQSVFDVEVNFQLGKAKASSRHALVAALSEYAAELALSHGIETYFAGLEPASDEDTRLFTGTEKGPYYYLS